MIARLALRNLAHRKRRTLFLLVGYGLGVGVMIVLLAIGEALLMQARDEKLVGGGQITVLPEGLDVEVMKTGGVGGLFFSIDNARFIYRQLLASPRLAPQVAAVAPQIDGKLVYVRARGREIAVRAAGELPSRSAAVGAVPPLAAGAWRDDALDQRWMAPTPYELYSDVDHFHLPSGDVAHAESWAEWHYFNVLSADGRQWAFITLMVAGDPRSSDWGGRVTVTLRRQDGATRRFAGDVPARLVRFSTTGADLALGSSSVTLTPEAHYVVRAQAREEGTGAPLALHLVVNPAPRQLFPGAALASGAFTSGYTVPGLRASATGSICVRTSCERYDGAPAYHDHNWGVWRGVTWDWGASRAGDFTFLYGRVAPPDSEAAPTPLFVYLVDSLGFRALFRPRAIQYTDGRTIHVHGVAVRVPSRAVMWDAHGDDTLAVELTIDDAIGTDTRQPFIERGDASAARAITHPYFIQMKGTARLSGRVGGAPVRGVGTGFFETYR